MRNKQRSKAAGLAALFLLMCLSGKAYAQDQYDPAVPTPTHSDLRYGEHERHVMDFWRAEADEPTPLVFIIHGGGWRGGSKERAQRFADVPALLEAGISVVAINYRLIQHATEEGVVPPVHAPLHDAAHALQFIRHNARFLNIDPTRIGAAGGSAGACSSLWLAFHDDLADPDHEDPVRRQSSRLQCAAVLGAQTSLDPAQVREWTPNIAYGGHAFGFGNFDACLAARDEIQPWIDAYSPYHQVSEGDPPVYLRYNRPPAIGQRERDATHSANYGVMLQRHCEALGVTCDVVYPGAENIEHETTTSYLIHMLTQEDE